MAEIVVVTTSCPDEALASRLAEAAVAERLAACAQVQGPIRSTFRWQGAVDHATEWYCHLKTSRDRYPALEARIHELHPYEVPEIVAVPVVAGSPAYLRWVEESVRG
jgi:periplasmic divalent cation tolerance protein